MSDTLRTVDDRLERENERLLSNAATCSQNTSLLDDEVLKECIILNIINPLRRRYDAERERADRNEKDAERYRFGRNDGVVVQISVLRDDTHWVRCGDDLDEAIDAAREGK